MAIRIPSEVINATTSEELARFRSQSDFLGRHRDIDLDPPTSQ